MTNTRTRRVAVSLAVIAALTLMVGHAADARPRPHARRFSANKTFGLGLMIGEPTALSGKYFLKPDQALDFGIGGMRYYRNRSGLQIHADYLWHPINLAHTQPFDLPLYIGVGGRVFDFNDNSPDGHGTALGLRVPFGIDFDFNETPIDIFVELAFVVDFFVDYAPDNYGTDLNGAVGIRYWFN